MDFYIFFVLQCYVYVIDFISPVTLNINNMLMIYFKQTRWNEEIMVQNPFSQKLKKTLIYRNIMF
jgi:hypothetical protein